VVGVVDRTADEQAERTLRQLGVDHVVTLPPSATAGDGLADAVRTAVDELEQRRRGPHALPWTTHTSGGTDTAASSPLHTEADFDPDSDSDSDKEPDVEPEPGRVLAVWGPTGAPGRSFLSWHLAGELATTGASVLLVDADVYGGTLAQYADVTDEAPGLVAACRAANAGALDVARLAGQARRLQLTGGASLSLLTGIGRASRWPELRPAALTRVLDIARRTAATTVVDCGFNLEEDEELSYDTLAPRRNGATTAVLAAADEVLVIGSADAVGVRRLIVGLTELRETLDAQGADPVVRVVVNRVRGSRREQREITTALARHGDVQPELLVPFDQDAADRALAAGSPLCEVVPRSPARVALEGFAAGLLPEVLVQGRGRSAGRRRWQVRAG
jgi:Flp pilus assembly CpaE family ATPase